MSDIAGLVLVALPLVIEGLDAYPDSSIARLFTAKRERREFVRQLREVQSGLRAEIGNLCRGMHAQLRRDQWATFRALDAKGSQFFEIWKDLLEKRPDLVETTTGAAIKNILEDMEKILNEVVEHSPAVLLENIHQFEHDQTFAGGHGVFRRFMFVRRSQRRRRLMKQLDNHVKSLRKLSKEHIQWSGLPGTVTREQVDEECSFLQDIRDECLSLYTALSKLSKCDCHHSATAWLRLEGRKPGGKEADIRVSVFLRFETSPADAGSEFLQTEVSIFPRFSSLPQT